jgi:4-alpha-glucanotransferase
MDLPRSSGTLLPITSLPGAWPAGDLGEEALKFADFLKKSGQTWWQILPVGPTDPAMDNSPYSSPSAFAGNPLLVNPEKLAERGYLKKEELAHFKSEKQYTLCDYSAARQVKENIFKLSWDNFPPCREEEEAFESFRLEHAVWLEDYALFSALRQRLGHTGWRHWPKELRDRDEGALKSARAELSEETTFQEFLQFLFFRQWDKLREHCTDAGIGLIGDMPFYVSEDSSDVWANRSFFHLDAEGSPLESAGVPPDYFSATGQLWGNPVYRWNELKDRDYSWWVERISHNLRLYDLVRIDHFRGFIDYWAVPAGSKTAAYGHWEKGPGRDFFHALEKYFPGLPLLAENLGTITPEVTEIMREFNLPGMLVLLFAFGDNFAENPYAPHNHNREDFVYTGTHDNNTARGWFENELDLKGKLLLERYLGHKPTSERVHRDLVRMAFQSVARVSIIPLQDLLGLGAEARINTPSTTRGNWRWRVPSGSLSDNLASFILGLAELTGRKGPRL